MPKVNATPTFPASLNATGAIPTPTVQSQCHCTAHVDGPMCYQITAIPELGMLIKGPGSASNVCLSSTCAVDVGERQHAQHMKSTSNGCCLNLLICLLLTVDAGQCDSDDRSELHSRLGSRGVGKNRDRPEFRKQRHPTKSPTKNPTKNPTRNPVHVVFSASPLVPVEVPGYRYQASKIIG